jgi:uncharacterized membrane protein YjjB (DUF3815 family)
MPGPESAEKRRKINLTPSQVAASALAASCAALVASTLGVAGTLIGAAVGSVVTTTGAALYSHLFHTGGKKIADTINSVGGSIPLAPRSLVTRPHVGTGADPTLSDRALIDPALVETVLAGTAMAQSIPADRLYGASTDAAANAFADAPTVSQAPSLWTPQPTAPADPAAALGPLREAREPALEAEQTPGRGSGRSARLRKPIALAAAVAAVFGVSVVIGMLAGQPIRQATGSPGPSTSHSTAPQTPASQSAGSTSGTESGAASSSPSAGSPSATPDSSAAPTSSGGASAPAGAGGATSDPNAQSTAEKAGSGGAAGAPVAAGSGSPVG